MSYAVLVFRSEESDHLKIGHDQISGGSDER